MGLGKKNQYTVKTLILYPKEILVCKGYYRSNTPTRKYVQRVERYRTFHD